MEHFYDLVVIGSGSAGSFAAREAASVFGKRVAVVEKLRWGGDCMTVACKPTKTYLTSAELYQHVRALGPELGVLADNVRLDFRRVKERKDGFVVQASGEARRRNLREHGIDLFDGRARFLDSRTLAVGDDLLVGENILLAIGSLPAEPPIPGLAEAGALTNETALDLDEIPGSLLVIGAGAVGVEFGQMFSRFGSRVTILEAMPRILPRMDADAAASLHAALEQEGIEILTGARLQRLEHSDGSIRAFVQLGEAERQLVAERVLNAVGRRPDIDGLELEAAGLHLQGPALPVDAYCETDVRGIWAAGDITGIAQFTPIANYQGRLAVRNMFSDEREPADYRALPSAVFTDPEVTSAGPSEEQAREQGHDIETASVPLRGASRAGFTGRPHGLAKLVYERDSGRVLGVHLVTPTASDSIQFLSVAIRLGVTVDDLARSIHAYPTFGEIVKGAAEQAQRARSAVGGTQP
jgi:pyruvate/2-oxoglutarate dehydrogenase complex dihydrolipoamide dehydrogenase (E3) component